MRKPKRLGTAAVEQAIREARTLARERGVPLTLERVAACLGLHREQLRELALSPETAGLGTAAAARLRQVYLDCNAALIEELMASKGSHPGAVLLAKNNFGYTDRAEAAPTVLPVRFVGEDRLED